MSKWIGTSNNGFSPYAMEELRRIFESIRFEQLVPGEVFLIEIPKENDEVLAGLEKHECIFLRHIQPIDRELKAVGDERDLLALRELISYIESSVAHKQVAVHVRASKGAKLAASKAEVRQQLNEALEQAGATISLQSPELIIAVYAHQEYIWVGFGTVEEMRSSWPGGAVRFQREDNQISRAKFKLLEAEQAFGLDFTLFKNAIDVGAAPGGWTSLLLERGLRVTAIDPANLDERLIGYPGLTHLKKNASEVKLPKASFDLLVCDMSWSPNQMSKLVLELQYALMPYAYGIITVKLMHKKGMQSIREVKERLSSSFHILRAKQLFHNREEITLFIQRKS